MTDSHQTTSSACVPPIAELLITLPRAADTLDGRPRLEQHPARLPTVSPALFAFPPLAHSSTTTEQQLHHCRPRVAIVVRAHHRKNASASSFVASLCSSPPPPPLSRVVWGLVRAHSPFPPPPPWRDLAGVGAPRGQLPPWPSHPLLCAWLAW